MAGSARRRALLLLLAVVLASSLCARSAAPLAAERTRRKDPLDGLRPYTGGWNISDRHYVVSVAFSAAPVFVAAADWFVGFAVAIFADPAAGRGLLQLQVVISSTCR